MQLVEILLVIIAALSALAGVATFLGAPKSERLHACLYLVACLSGAAWLSLTVFHLNKISTISHLDYAELDTPAPILPALLFFLFAIILAILSFIKAKRTRTRSDDHGARILVISLAASLAITLITEVALPFSGNLNLFWLGPLSASLLIFSHFYATLRYHLYILNARWLRILAYLIILSLAAVFYMTIFYLILHFLFKFPDESASTIIILNFVMIVIVLMLFPVVNEATTRVRSLISVNQVDLTYVIKSLNRYATQNVNLNELADFLASHLHFSYIGFIINNRLYGSSHLKVSADELTELSVLEPADRGIWQKISPEVKPLTDNLGITAVAELRNANGRPFGQILVGQPLGKETFAKRDLAQLELVVNLVASIIDSKRRLKV